MKSILFKLCFLIALALLLLQSCGNRTTEDKQRLDVLAKLPSALARQADSLMQIEDKLARSEAPGFVASNIQEQIAMLLMERAPQEGIEYLKKVIDHHYENERYNEVGYLHLFVARAYEEKLHQPAKALEHLFEAGKIWNEDEDPIKTAALLQYEGVMEAKLGRTDEGLQKIRKAIDIYRENQFGDEIYTSYYDLARAYHIAGRPEEGMKYLEEAYNYWTDQRNYGRLILANNLKLRILSESGQLEDALQIYQTNDSLISQVNLHWMPLLDFLQLSRSLLQKTGRLDEFTKIEDRYRTLTDSLDQEKLIYFE